MIVRLALFLIVLSLPAGAAEHQATYIRNYDGDTVTVYIDGRRAKVRVSNIDTPEMNATCRDARGRIDWQATARARGLAMEARAFTRRFASGPLTIVTGTRERDKYGRLLGTVANERGQDLGAALIDAGLARRWTGRREPWCATR